MKFGILNVEENESEFWETMKTALKYILAGLLALAIILPIVLALVLR